MSKLIHTPYAIFFLLIISFPLIFTPFSNEKRFLELQEKRIATPFPDLQATPLIEIPRKLDRYIDDNFPFRNVLISNTNIIRTRWLKVPSDHVIVGRDDWLFYKGDDIFEDLMGQRRFSDTELQEWLSKYDQKYQWLKENDIGYLLVTIPNKSTVYPERLPWWLKLNRGETRLSQISAAIAQRGSPPFLNLSKVVENVKASGQEAYWFNDTHWSGPSLQAGLFALFERCQTIIPELNPSDILNLGSLQSTTSPGDLANLSGLSRFWPKRERVQLKISTPQDMRLASTELTKLERYSEIEASHHTYPVVIERDSGSGTALIFHDSYFRSVAHSSNPVAKHPAALPFRRSILIWGRPTLEQIKEVVEIEKPDIVIEERVERLLIDENIK